MSLGLRLLANLSKPASDPGTFLSAVEEWLDTKNASMHPKSIRTEIDSRPALLCTLHPAAEPVEFVLVQQDQLIVSANTTTVGPGYHIFLASLLKELAKAIGASWDEAENGTEEFGDETGYFFSSDENRLREEMKLWLSSLAATFFEDSDIAGWQDIALCLPMNPQFTCGSLALTPMGPRNLDWLAKVAKDGSLGIDFFAWWDQGFTAEYFLNRALTQMWTEARWRLPVNDSEAKVLQEIADCLHKAYELDPTLNSPWTEWNEILKLLDQNGEMAKLVSSKATHPPKIGYRRNSVIVTLPGGWKIRVPGSFSEFISDEEGDLYAVDPPHEIWFTAYRSGNPSIEDFLASKSALKRNPSDMEIENHGYFATASISEKESDKGKPYFLLKSSNLAVRGRSICTIVFPNRDDEAWALETWRSLQPPPEPQT